VSAIAPETSRGGSVDAADPLGMHGGVRLRAERICGRTRITELVCRPPLQVLRAHHLDPRQPDMASVILASPAGGILQGDRLRIDVTVGSGAKLRVGTQSATRIYRSPVGEALQEVRLEVEAGGYLEYLPNPFIPYAGSRFISGTTAVVAPDATLMISEVVAPGRAARGEILAFERFESAVDIARPDGTLLATDAVILDRREPMGLAGSLGRYVAVGTLLVIGPGISPSILRDAVDAWAAPSAFVGVSTLPNDAGAWLRVLADSVGEADAVVAAAHAAARRALFD
jgi:urease accessory protein